LCVMPVHRDREKKENIAEDMELEEQEHEASTSDEEDSETSTSVFSDVAEMDEEDCERRRMECLDEMATLEKQFNDLKDQLYRERLSQVSSKLAEVEGGRAAEYLEPLTVLLENIQNGAASVWTQASHTLSTNSGFCGLITKKQFFLFFNFVYSSWCNFRARLYLWF
uniref:Uncharacterized protein n=1 Tax=Nothobranchius furzeri TaxID=105023 RepID=A0A8C6P124_NOTFU